MPLQSHSFLFPGEEDTISIDSYLSTIRPSAKYHVPNFRNRSLDELKKQFPSESLSALDNQHENWNMPAAELTFPKPSVP